MSKLISIIIPVLNEETRLKSLLGNLSGLSGDVEVIVVDGGSTDGSMMVAAEHARVLVSEPGRAAQMNAGASIATGSVYWFVHADSVVPSRDSVLAIQAAVDNGASFGCFSLYFHDSNTFMMRLTGFFSTWRARYLGWVFGDQGIFVTAYFFKQLEGFPMQPIMEDLQFSLNAKRLSKASVIDLKIGTSARRFTEAGVLKTLWLMHRLKYDYFRGVSADQLWKRYQ